MLNIAKDKIAGTKAQKYRHPIQFWISLLLTTVSAAATYFSYQFWQTNAHDYLGLLPMLACLALAPVTIF